jgi:hypothetical protein
LAFSTAAWTMMSQPSSVSFSEAIVFMLSSSVVSS